MGLWLPLSDHALVIAVLSYTKHKIIVIIHNSYNYFVFVS